MAMRSSFRKDFDLEDPVPLCENVYLGCGQREIDVPPEIVSEKQNTWKELFDKILDLAINCEGVRNP